MTIQKLHRILGGMIDEGHGRKPVAINKRTFGHNLESDGAVVLEVRGASIDWVLNIDDDGGRKENKDGSESGRNTCVLTGDWEPV